MKHSDNAPRDAPDPRRFDRPLDNGRRLGVKKTTELRDAASRVSDKPAPRLPSDGASGR